MSPRSRALGLQVMQDSERAGMDLAEAHAPLGALALDVSDDAIDVAIALEHVPASLCSSYLYIHQKMGARAQIDLRLELDRVLVRRASGESAATSGFTWTSISNIAMFSPMQCRGPTEKGM